MKLIHGDCLKELPKLKDKSIDMVLTDMPYGTTACSWDNVLDMTHIWKHIKRCIRSEGAIALFGVEPFSSSLRLSNIDMWKYDWIWIKGKETCGDFVQAKNRPIKNSEIISMFSFGKTFHKGRTRLRMRYNPQGLKLINKKIKGSISLNNLRTVTEKANRPEDYVRKYTGYPSHILEFKSKLRNRHHPTEKPIALLEYLIKTYTKEGETVLDFTMGSGSTGVACVNTNRNFIGIELEKKYFDIAKDRVKEAKRNFKQEGT